MLRPITLAALLLLLFLTNYVQGQTILPTAGTVNTSVPYKYRTNWCPLMMKTISGAKTCGADGKTACSISNVLYGQTINIGIEGAGIVDEAYIVVDDTTLLPTGGYFFALQKLLSAAAGFSIQYVQLPVKVTASNGLYSAQVVQYVDLYGGRPVSDSSANRQLKIDFTYEVNDGSQSLYVPIPRTPPKDMWNFATPFTPMLWGIIVALIVAHATVNFFLEPKPGAGFLGPFVGAAGHFVMGSKLEPKKFWMQWLNVGFAFCCTILANTYTANLAAALIAASQTTFAITGIAYANTQRIKVCVQTGTAAATTLSTYFTGIRTVLEPLYAARGLASGLCTGAFLAASDADIAMTRAELNPTCTLGMVGDKVRTFSFSWPLALDYDAFCTSFMNQALYAQFLALKSKGAMDAAWQDALSVEQTITCPAAGQAALALDTPDMQGVFILYLICLGTSLIVYFSGRYLPPIYTKIVEDGKKKKDAAGAADAAAAAAAAAVGAEGEDLALSGEWVTESANASE